MKQQQEQRVITCTNCKERMTYEQAVTTRTVEGRPGVEEVGLLCPGCDTWTHAYYTDQLLRNARAKLAQAIARFQTAEPTQRTKAEHKMRTAQRKHQRLFDRTQRRLRKELLTPA